MFTPDVYSGNLRRESLVRCDVHLNINLPEADMIWRALVICAESVHYCIDRQQELFPLDQEHHVVWHVDAILE
jgi:hypothetical protein